jgi:hypothetical protein
MIYSSNTSYIIKKAIGDAISKILDREERVPRAYSTQTSGFFVTLGLGSLVTPIKFPYKPDCLD